MHAIFQLPCFTKVSIIFKWHRWLKKITFLFCLAFLRYVFKIKMDWIKVMSIFKQEAHRLDGHLSTVTNAKLLTDNGRPTAIGNPCDLKKTCSLYGHIFHPHTPLPPKVRACKLHSLRREHNNRLILISCLMAVMLI